MGQSIRCRHGPDVPNPTLSLPATREQDPCAACLPTSCLPWPLALEQALRPHKSPVRLPASATKPIRQCLVPPRVRHRTRRLRRHSWPRSTPPRGMVDGSTTSDATPRRCPYLLAAAERGFKLPQASAGRHLSARSRRRRTQCARGHRLARRRRGAGDLASHRRLLRECAGAIAGRARGQC